jgi:uncharacterized glyoxalase superfamily protein PhnB
MTTFIPTLKYDDAGATIKWLCAAFGFQKHLVVPGDTRGFHMANLRLAAV